MSLVAIIPLLLIPLMEIFPPFFIDEILTILHYSPTISYDPHTDSGHWSTVKCSPESMVGISPDKIAFCETNTWQWDSPPDCPISNIGVLKARQMFLGKKIVFMGDSIMRNVFFQFDKLIDPDHSQNTSSSIRHSDIIYEQIFMKNSSLTFHWAPLVSNITSILVDKNIIGNNDLVIIGSAAWQALHNKDIVSYSKDLDILSDTINSTISNHNNNININNNKKTTIIWLQPTTIIDEHLTTQEKLTYMTESTIDLYRKSFINSKISNIISSIIDPRSACINRETIDGIHYNQDVYSVIAQMAVNVYALRTPSLLSLSSNNKKKKIEPKITGSMSFPSYGAFVLILSGIMLFSMDSFLGIGFLSLLLFGRSSDWEAAYGPLHKKILKSPGNGVNTEKPLFSRSSIGTEEGDNLLERERSSNGENGDAKSPVA